MPYPRSPSNPSSANLNINNNHTSSSPSSTVTPSVGQSSASSSRLNQNGHPTYSQLVDQLQDLLSQKENTERIIDGAQGLLNLVENASGSGNGSSSEDLGISLTGLLNTGMDYSAIKVEVNKELINAERKLSWILGEIETARDKLATLPSPSTSIQSDLGPQYPTPGSQHFHSPYSNSALGLQGTSNQGSGPSLVSLHSSGTSLSAESPASHTDPLDAEASNRNQAIGSATGQSGNGGRNFGDSNSNANENRNGDGTYKSRAALADQEAMFAESDRVEAEMSMESEKARESTKNARSQAIVLIQVLGKLNPTISNARINSRPSSSSGGNQNQNQTHDYNSKLSSDLTGSNHFQSSTSTQQKSTTKNAPFPWTNQNQNNSNDQSGMSQTVGMPPPNLPSMTRSAQRSRAARVAGNQASSHVRTPSHASGLGDLPKRRLDILNRLTMVLDKNLRGRYELPLDDLLDSVFPCLSDNAGKECRTAAYRLLRYALVRPPWPLICRCRARGLDYYLTRTFLRDNRFELEKEAALKLVRAVMETGAASAMEPQPQQIEEEAPLEGLIGEGTIRALVSLSDHSEEKLRHLCLETLAELAIFDLRLLIRGGGLRTVLQSLNDGPPELAPVLVQAFLHLIDMPSTREYLRPGVDLEVALSGFTDAPAMKDLNYEETLKTTSKVVSVMLRSWTGLLYLCMNGKHAVASLVLALKINASDVRDSILDMFYELLRINPSSSSAHLSSDLTSKVGSDGKPTSAQETATEVIDQKASTGRLNMIDQYQALLLLVCIDVGLIDALVHVVSTAEQSRKATLLLGEILHLSNRVLPRLHGAQMYTLPQLFTLASKFKAGDHGRQTATSALSSIDGLDRQRVRQNHTKGSLIRKGSLMATNGISGGSNRDRSGSGEERIRSQRHQTEIGRTRAPVQIDDQAFRLLLLESQVLNTKEHTRWKDDMLIEMLEGPLLNPKRLEEAMRGSKFIRRLLSFFHPFQLRFSSIRLQGDNRKYIRLGCVLINTLLANPDGVKFLMEDKLLKELRECLDQLDPMAGVNTSEPLMSKSRIQETLTVGYFQMIGTLTQSSEGIKVLESFKIFTRLYHLADLRSRDDLIREVIENVDYSIDGHPRVILSKALTSTPKSVRIFSTRHLAKLIERVTFSLSSSISSSNNLQNTLDIEWMISLLLVQLYDVSIEVRKLTVEILEEICKNSMKNLEIIVSMRPTLDHLGETGHALLLRFLSTSVGFKYLWEGGYVDRELDDWFHERNLRYTVQLEVLLDKALALSDTSSSSNKFSLGQSDEEFDGTVPPHFYGILTKTTEGCEILEEKGHFREFSRFIKRHGMESRDTEVISKLKSVLWAVGNIASSSQGLTFLEADDLLSTIVEIAESSLVLSLRGTCFYVLGLISSTEQGMQLLDDYGWHSVCSPLGTPMGLCIPSEIDRFVEIPAWTPRLSPSIRYLSSAPPPTGIERSILTSISNLGNSILAARAQRSLAKLKESHRSAFSSPSVIVRSFAILDGFALRAPVRRYVWELFDVKLDESTVGKLTEEKKKLQSKSKTSIHSSTISRTKWAEAEAEAAADVAFDRIRRQEIEAGLDPDGDGASNSVTAGETEELESEEDPDEEGEEEEEELEEEAFSLDGDLGIRPLDLDGLAGEKGFAGMAGENPVNSDVATNRSEVLKPDQNQVSTANTTRALPYNTITSKQAQSQGVAKQVLDPRKKIIGGFGEIKDGSLVVG